MNKIIKRNGKLNIIGDKVREYREGQNLSLSQLSNKLMLMGIDIPISKKGKELLKNMNFVLYANFLMYLWKKC